MSEKNFLAVDLGATSGRTIIGTICPTGFQTTELTRFPNPIIEVNGHFYWDVYALYYEIILALKKIAKQNIHIESIGIDTWGVDFAFVGSDRELLRLPYSYRDPQTRHAPEIFFERIPRDKVYELTGIEIMNFNSLYQLDTIRRNKSTAWPLIDKVVFMPDLLAYMLTGNMVTEYTIASTSQLLNAHTKRLEPILFEALGLEQKHFGDIVFPGTTIGYLNAEVRRQTGLGAIPVIAVAGHDTGSAVASVPAEDNNFAYLSSGTWSLMGIEMSKPVINERSYKLNFTNEGGVDGTILFMKNICGMWLLECCRKEWAVAGNDWSYSELMQKAQSSKPFACLINPDAPCFTNPASMVQAIQDYGANTGQYIPRTEGELARCIFESLALRYKQIFELLQTFADRPIHRLHVIGGGSQNTGLNQFTANALGIEVVAGPTEATAIGNIFLQARASGQVSSLDEMRSFIRKSVALQTFSPSETIVWKEAYQTYREICGKDF